MTTLVTDADGLWAAASHRATQASPRALFHGLGHSVGIAAASLAAFDEATECLTRRDFAGFDAAMRIFRKVSQEGTGAAQEAARRNNGN